MRGLASITLVLLLAVALLSLLEGYSLMRERNLQTSTYALELERSHYKKLDLKHAVLQAIAAGAAEGTTREERAENAAERLSELGEYLGADAEVWCGVISESELKRLPRDISNSGNPAKCSSCWAAGQKKIFYEAFPEKRAWLGHRCASFLDVDTASGKVGVSKGGLSITRDPEAMAAQFSGRFVLGISYYDKITGVGSIALVPEGTWVGYG